MFKGLFLSPWHVGIIMWEANNLFKRAVKREHSEHTERPKKMRKASKKDSTEKSKKKTSDPSVCSECSAQIAEQTESVFFCSEHSQIDQKMENRSSQSVGSKKMHPK